MRRRPSTSWRRRSKPSTSNPAPELLGGDLNWGGNQKAPRGALAGELLEVVGFSLGIPLFEGAESSGGEGHGDHAPGGGIQEPFGLHVGVLHATCFTVGVAHVVTGKAALSGDLAHSRHNRGVLMCAECIRGNGWCQEQSPVGRCPVFMPPPLVAPNQVPPRDPLVRAIHQYDFLSHFLPAFLEAK